MDSLTLMLSLFREKVTQHSEIREQLRHQLLFNIREERLGNVIDRSLIRESLLMMVQVSVQYSISVYEEDFEQYFLQETDHFYRTETLDYISSNSCTEYMSNITRRLAEESERLSNYLAMETESKLRWILEQRLLVDHIRALIDMDRCGVLSWYRMYVPRGSVSSIPSSVANSADLPSSGFLFASASSASATPIIDELKRFYTLFARVPTCLEIIRDTLGQEIIRRGQDILTSQETTRDPVIFVKDILTLKDQFDEIVALAYRNDKRLEKRVKESFQVFINRDNRTAAHLSAYLDDFFRKGQMGLSETDIALQLDKVIVIFHFLSDKDVFEEYYKNALCKRLLNAKSSSDDYEKLMISKLKAECGYQYTTKLEGMFVDMNISKAVMETYRASEYPGQIAPLEIDVQVLTTGFWPLQPSHQCLLTSEIQQLMSHFTNFYLNQHSGRKLTWYPSISSNDVRANFPLGKKELNVTTFQWCILSLFNQKESWSYEHIKEATKIPDLELRRHLLSLCTPKLRILNKASRGKVRYRYTDIYLIVHLLLYYV
jgi:cullin 3